MKDIPSGYCQCGCGRRTPIVASTDKQRGRIRGEPSRFLPGHNKQKPILHDDPNPSGYCKCGCGQKTRIAERTRRLLGWVKGKHLPYIVGHSGFGGRPKPLIERFWEHVEKRGPDECWLWIGRKNSYGYGSLAERGRNILAHRFSYEIHKGKIPAKMAVCHACDVRNCVNPNHLWLGTSQENNADRTAKGRTISGRTLGEGHGMSKLTADQVREIRLLLQRGDSATAIAKQFGVSPGNIWNIKTGKTWRHTR